MKAFFEESSKQKIPDSFQDCYKTDPLALRLFRWAEIQATIGSILSIISIVATIATSIYAIIGFILVGKIDLPFLIIPFACLAFAFFVYEFFHANALKIASHASIVNSTKISANVALYNSAKENISIHCPICNKEIRFGDRACSCGQKFNWEQ